MKNTILSKRIQNAYREYERLSKMESAMAETIIENAGANDVDAAFLDELNDEFEKISELYWDSYYSLNEMLQKAFNLNRSQANAMMHSEKFINLMHMTIVD